MLAVMAQVKKITNAGNTFFEKKIFFLKAKKYKIKNKSVIITITSVRFIAPYSKKNGNLKTWPGIIERINETKRIFIISINNFLWTREGSNLWPSQCECDALTS